MRTNFHIHTMDASIPAKIRTGRTKTNGTRAYLAWASIHMHTKFLQEEPELACNKSQNGMHLKRHSSRSFHYLWKIGTSLGNIFIYLFSARNLYI